MKYARILASKTCTSSERSLNHSNFIKTLDIFGKPVKVTQFGEDTLRSSTGGICSIFIFCFILMFFTLRILNSNSNISVIEFERNP